MMPVMRAVEQIKGPLPLRRIKVKDMPMQVVFIEHLRRDPQRHQRPAPQRRPPEHRAKGNHTGQRHERYPRVPKHDPDP